MPASFYPMVPEPSKPAPRVRTRSEPLHAYASQTGTRRNRAALKGAGWGFLLAPLGQHECTGEFHFMIDCGEWSRFTWEQELERRRRGEAPLRRGWPDRRFPEEMTLDEVIELKFSELLDKCGRQADYLVLPDRVASPISLERSLYWMEALAQFERPLLLPVQDGMTLAQVRPYLGFKTFDALPGEWGREGGRPFMRRASDARARSIQIPVGIFLGGSTEWKLKTMELWGELAQELGVPYHVARVNTGKRMRQAYLAGATSVDGSCATRYACQLPALDRVRRGLNRKLTPISFMHLPGRSGAPLRR